MPVWAEGGVLFTERERAALAWAETVTRVSETGAPDSDYAAAAAVFSEKELADLTYAIGLMNAFNRFGVAFRPAPRACFTTRPSSTPSGSRSSTPSPAGACVVDNCASASTRPRRRSR